MRGCGGDLLAWQGGRARCAGVPPGAPTLLPASSAAAPRVRFRRAHRSAPRLAGRLHVRDGRPRAARAPGKPLPPRGTAGVATCACSCADPSGRARPRGATARALQLLRGSPGNLRLRTPGARPAPVAGVPRGRWRHAARLLAPPRCLTGALPPDPLARPVCSHAARVQARQGLPRAQAKRARVLPALSTPL